MGQVDHQQIHVLFCAAGRQPEGTIREHKPTSVGEPCVPRQAGMGDAISALDIMRIAPSVSHPTRDPDQPVAGGMSSTPPW